MQGNIIQDSSNYGYWKVFILNSAIVAKISR